MRHARPWFFCVGAIARRAGAAASHGTRRATPTSPDRQRRTCFSSPSTRCERTPSARTVRRRRGRRRSMRSPARGVRFDRAFAPTPITLPSHASLLTGLYPPGHGARHNGIAMRGDVPTLALACEKAGFANGGVRLGVSARSPVRPGARVRAIRRPFPARRRHASAQRAARIVDGGRGDRVAGSTRRGRSKTGPSTRFFLWVHLFEPHAPYGNPRDGRPARERYADEVAEADQAGGAAARGAGTGALERRSSSPPAIMARRSASTARSATASSCTTRRCAFRS